jgi:hypothetical protein
MERLSVKGRTEHRPAPVDAAFKALDGLMLCLTGPASVRWGLQAERLPKNRPSPPLARLMGVAARVGCLRRLHRDRNTIGAVRSLLAVACARTLSIVRVASLMLGCTYGVARSWGFDSSCA